MQSIKGGVVKKYIIRNIGWFYDDEQYNFDGEQRVEAIYERKSEALNRVDELNHMYFMALVFINTVFQSLYTNYEGSEEHINRDRLARLIADAIDVDVDTFYSPRKGFFLKNDGPYKELLTKKHVKEILAQLKFKFFICSEVEEGNIAFYKFKRNPEVWSPVLIRDQYMTPEELYDYYYNEEGSELRLVRTKAECYFYALNSWDPIRYELNHDKLISGTYEALSTTPDLLAQVIKNSPHIAYDETGKYLVFHKEVTPEEVMSLDSVLKHPILIIEEHILDEKSITNKSDDYYYKALRKKFSVPE